MQPKDELSFIKHHINRFEIIESKTMSFRLGRKERRNDIVISHRIILVVIAAQS
jgi:hypothetical protein